MVQTISDIPDASPATLAALPAEALMRLQEQADAHAKHAAQIVGALHAALVARYAAGLNDTGTHHRQDGDVAVTVTVPKKVKWDQVALNAASETILSWGENPADYLVFKLEVPERRYEAWPPAIRAVVDPARTVETGKPVIKLAPIEAKA